MGIMLRQANQETGDTKKQNPLIANTFKMSVLLILFLLIFLHLYSIMYGGTIKVISDDVIVGIALVIVLYLFVQELRDRFRLQALNQSLVDTQQQLELVQVDTIAVLILAEEARDPYIRGHSERVARTALEIARAMGLSKERQSIVERAGILHDIGKLGMANELVKKKTPLTEEEWEIVRRHPRRGYEILKPLEFLANEQEIILRHHERFDGQGYPDGLKAAETPLEARIIAAADTFDAMNSERPYREPLTREEIIEELKQAGGSQLDPHVVRVLLTLLERKPELWKRET